MSFYIEECVRRPQCAPLAGAAPTSRRGSLLRITPKRQCPGLSLRRWLSERRTWPFPFQSAKMLEKTLARAGKELYPVPSHLVCLPSLPPQSTKKEAVKRKTEALLLMQILRIFSKHYFCPPFDIPQLRCWNLALMRQHNFLPNSLSHHNTKVTVYKLDPREMTQVHEQ